jgi:hypothetical protein
LALARQLASVQNRLDAERKTRITREVTELAEGRIGHKEIATWVDMCVADESRLDVLAKIPLQAVVPVRPSITEIEPNTPLSKVMALPNSRADGYKRYHHVKDNWESLYQECIAMDRQRRGTPMAANTFSASLTTQFLLDGATTKLQNRWAALKCFVRDFGVDRYKPLATGQHKFVTAGGATQTNATNFESGDSVVTNVAISVSQYTQAFHVTNSELNSGLRMENLIEVNMATFADQIIQVATTPITAANFNVLAGIVRASGAFTFSDMQTAWGELKKSPIHNALLDGEYLARIINVPTQFQKTGVEPGTAWAEFGWDNIALNTNWLQAGPNVRGFFCNPQAIGLIAGLPLTPPDVPGNTLQETSMTIPGPDIAVAVYHWFSLSTRTMWVSYDLVFGSALLDASAGAILTSQ